MEWLIEHVDDPAVDTPIPGQETSGAAAPPEPSVSTAAAASAPPPPLLKRVSSQVSAEDAKPDELTEIFKRIRRKREFRPDSRVRACVTRASLLHISTTP